jgi:hypothetical protein
MAKSEKPKPIEPIKDVMDRIERRAPGPRR